MIRLGRRRHSGQILITILKLVLLFNIGKRLYNVAASSSPIPWIDVFDLPEKSNMAVTKSDPDPKVRKMSIPF